MVPDLWKLVRDGKGSVATHAMQIFFGIGIPTCHHVFVLVGMYLKERDIL